jgi:SET domain-containing protein
MKTDDVVVKKSNIQGNGVFAIRGFKKGEKVLHWDTLSVLSKEEVDEKSEEEKRHITYFEGKYVEMKSPEKYVNHSCDENTTIRDFCDVAIRDISKGEEITGNYSEDLFPGDTFKCNCKSRNCKRIIQVKHK